MAWKPKDADDLLIKHLGGELQEDPKVRGFLLAKLKHALEGDYFQSVVFAEDSAPPPPEALAPGRARMFVMLSGCRETLIARDGRAVRFPQRKGQILFAGSAAWHKPVETRAHSLLSVIFDPDSMAVTWKRRKHGERNERKGRRFWYFSPATPAGSIMHTLRAIEAFPASSRQGPGAALMTRALLWLVHEELVRNLDAPHRARSTWRVVRSYVREHFQEPINRDVVAQAMGLHPNHLSRLFRREAGEGFNQYLTRLRMEHAAHLIRRYGLAVKEIAAHCGFESENYFGKVFRRFHGTSPGRYA